MVQPTRGSILLGERLAREYGHAEGVTEERARLRPLLERCLVAVKGVPLFADLEADLRRELGKEG